MSQPITAPQARKVSRLWPIVSGGTAILAALGLGLIVALRANPYGVDAEWLEELVEHRSPLWDVPAYVMSFLGGGWFGVFLVPIGVGAALLIARKPWSALYFVVASAVSAGIVQLLKSLFARARPEQILVAADFGSFPSGHVANAATISVALAILLQRRWVWFAGAAWTLLMILSRTYLGAHWLSDTVGGLLLGGAVAVLLWAPLAARLQREWSSSAPPDSVAP
ncbi:MAG: phosphatase PAP2 family protein [Actinobacteria bacterium]|nr:phosphatase PAP2 family protein [Actinomycetota bacterium]